MGCKFNSLSPGAKYPSYTSAVQNFLSHVQPTISNTVIPPWHDAKLFNIISLGLPVALFPSNFFQLLPDMQVFPFSSHSVYKEFTLPVPDASNQFSVLVSLSHKTS